MPKALIDFLGYAFYFWSNENGEPLHIHVSKSSPTENGTKFWLTKDGIELENNNSQIPPKDLKKISRYILSNRSDIIASWYSHFGF